MPLLRVEVIFISGCYSLKSQTGNYKKEENTTEENTNTMCATNIETSDIITIVVGARQSQIAILTFAGAITGIVAAAVINANVQTNLKCDDEKERILFINKQILSKLIPNLLFFVALLYAGESLKIYQIWSDSDVLKNVANIISGVILYVSPILVLTLFALTSKKIASIYSKKPYLLKKDQ